MKALRCNEFDKLEPCLSNEGLKPIGGLQNWFSGSRSSIFS